MAVIGTSQAIQSELANSDDTIVASLELEKPQVRRRKSRSRT
jgi:hypothetical protein